PPLPGVSMLALAPRPRRAVLLLAAATALACGGTAPAPAPELLASQTAAVSNLPDFTIQSVSGPASSVSGGSIQISVVVCNTGIQPGTSYAVIYLSTDTNITTADVAIAGTPTMTLPPGTCTPVTAQGWASVPNGTYYFGAIVDPSNTVLEQSETNNKLAGSRI